MALLTARTKCSIDLEKTVTLSTAGSTETFTHSAITADSMVDFYCSQWDVVPEDIVCTAGSCTVTLPAVDESASAKITLRVYIWC